MGKCQLIENAKNDPNYNSELNAKLCKGDCDSCPHNIESEQEKVSKLLDALYNYFERKIKRRNIIYGT